MERDTGEAGDHREIADGQAVRSDGEDVGQKSDEDDGPAHLLAAWRTRYSGGVLAERLVAVPIAAVRFRGARDVALIDIDRELGLIGVSGNTEIEWKRTGVPAQIIEKNLGRFVQVGIVPSQCDREIRATAARGSRGTACAPAAPRPPPSRAVILDR